MFDWKKVLLKPDDTMEYAIKVLHEGGCRIALVSDEHYRLLGTITDGDIRRAIIKQSSMKSPVSLIMNSNPLTINDKVKNEDILSLMTDKGVLHMPILYKDGTLVDWKPCNI